MHKKLIAWALTLLVALPAAQAADEFLPPDQAFVISAQSSDGKSVVRFNWDRRRLLPLPEQIPFPQRHARRGIRNVVLPDGVTKDDPIFGEGGRSTATR